MSDAMRAIAQYVAEDLALKIDDTIMANAVPSVSSVYPYDGSLTYPWWDNPWAPSYPAPATNPYISVTSPPEKVRLSPAELDMLRKAAAKDDDLRAVLQKLRGKIEVEVDFEP